MAAALATVAVCGFGGTSAALPNGDSSVSIKGDGYGYVSYVKDDGTLVAVNVRTGFVRKLRSADGCHPLDAVRSRILLDCVDDKGLTRRPQLTSSPFRGTTVPVPGSNMRNRFSEIGVYWAKGEVFGLDYSSEIYSNWRTGKSLFCDIGCFMEFDLNSPRARTEVRFPEVMKRVDFPTTRAKSRNFCLEYLIENSRIAVINYDRLYVWKASMKRPGAIGPRAHGCVGRGQDPGVELGRGRITWVAGRHLFSVDRRTLRLRATNLKVNGASAVPTSRGVVVSVPNGDGSSKVRFVR